VLFQLVLQHLLGGESLEMDVVIAAIAEKGVTMESISTIYLLGFVEDIV
jgi:hypothetical protein